MINGTILKNITSYYKQGENHKKFKDWQNSAILQLSEAILLAFGFLAYAVYKIIGSLRRSLLKNLVISSDTDNKEHDSPEEGLLLPMLTRRPTVLYLPDIEQEDNVV